jgi:hypothetical protein
MSKSPLREYLESLGTTAEAWATDNGFSAWSVRHWSRGDKLPELDNQVALSEATDGKVSPEAWLAWSIERRRPSPEAA